MRGNHANLGDLKARCASLGIDIGFSENARGFQAKKRMGNRPLQNSLAILPMEGCDAESDGSPSALTMRRYQRFAGSGAALLWFEATAVSEDGKASPRQLLLRPGNVAGYKALTEAVKQKYADCFGFAPILILQLTHSGRYAKPHGAAAPVMAVKNPVLDQRPQVSAGISPVSDERLLRLEGEYVTAALCAREAGFDGVDIKACHGYLLSELLAAHTREGAYGGDFEGRTRLLRNIVEKTAAQLGPDFLVTTRLSMWDAVPYPYGFGADPASGLPDLREPAGLLRILGAMGLSAAATTVGNPYYNPHFCRPFDTGAYAPPEDPLQGVSRVIGLTGRLKRQVPGVLFVGGGYTYLGKFAANAGAYALEHGMVDMVGFGRQAIADPNLLNDFLNGEPIDDRRLCITCSKCTEIMRSGGTTGCVIRDGQVYRGIYTGTVSGPGKSGPEPVSHCGRK